MHNLKPILQIILFILIVECKAVFSFEFKFVSLLQLVHELVLLLPLLFQGISELLQGISELLKYQFLLIIQQEDSQFIVQFDFL